MSDVTPTPLTLPEGSCFENPQQVLNLFAAFMRVTIPGEFSAVNTGNTEPGVNDRDKPWIRKKADGSPDKVFEFFGGQWVSRHTLLPGHIVLYQGTLADLTTYDGGDANPAGPASGPMWEECTDFRARFPLHPGTLASGTIVAEGDTGGEEKHTLTIPELPAHDHDHPDGQNNCRVDRSAGANGVAINMPSAPIVSDVESAWTDETGEGQAHNNMPPYIAAFYIRRTSRLFYLPTG